MSGESKTRYCPFCGYPQEAYETTCGSCGRSLPYVPPTAENKPAPYPPPGGNAPPRSGMPGWALGLIGCAVFTPILVVVVMIVAAIAIPNFMMAGVRQKVNGAESNLNAIWAAQQSWAAKHDGEYLEFSITPDDQEDPNWQALGVRLPSIHHAYEAFYDEDDEFWITAVGNVDEDEFEDEWELSASVGSPDHYANDVTDEYHELPEDSDYYADEEEEPIDQSGVEGGVVGGLAASDPDDITRTDSRAQTARKNLLAIFEKQKSYRAKKKTWLTFSLGSDAQWKALGVALPEEAHHTYSATASGTKLTIVAEGNLDGDAFVDRWTLESDDGVPRQWKNDALNLDLSGLKAEK